MFPASFDYHKASSVEEAVRLLEELEDLNPALLAGGHSLIPMMKQRLAQPGALVDIRGVDELVGISKTNNSITVGALTRHVDLETSDFLAENATCLAEAAAEIGDVQIRNRGTIGGNLANADPSADLPAPVLALGGTLRIAGPSDERRVKAQQFFQGMFMTALEENQVLTHIEIPLADSTISTYVKKTSPSSGYALAGVAAVLEVQEDVVREARIAVNGVASTPTRLSDAEAALVDQPLTPEIIESVSQRTGGSLEDHQILDDTQAGPDYRRQLLKSYTRKALNQLAERSDRD